MTAFLLSIVLILAGAARAPGETPDSSSVSGESERAHRFFEQAFDELLARSPMRQTYLGIKTDYDKLDDLSTVFADATNEIRKRQLRDLAATIDYELLDEEGRLSYDLFVLSTEQSIEGHGFRDHHYLFDQMNGHQSSLPAFLINAHRITSIEDAEAYIHRLNAFPAYLEPLIDRMQGQVEMGIAPPRFVYDFALSDSRNVISGRPFDQTNKESALYEDFRNKLEPLDAEAATKERLLAEAAAALQERVRPAYEDLIARLEVHREQATTKDGVWKLPEGDAFYAHQLRVITTTDLSADEIHDIGVAEVARIHDEMRGVMLEVGFEGTLAAFFAYMREDPRFYYDNSQASRDRYLREAEAIIEDMKGRLPELFLRQPAADLVVKAVEPFREASAGKAFYQQPAPDGSRPGTYYANLYRMEDMPTYQMAALAYHEGIPGHHMQISLAQEIDGLPRFRKYGRFTAYTEGWGLYAELVPKELGLYQDPYSDFGRLAMELWRACRLVVDTGIHAKQWTREQATQYLIENTPNPPGDAQNAIDRYIVMPGQANAYKLGMIKIVELREEARSELGALFDLREFHDVVLRNGPVPLFVLEDLVESWIEKKRNA